MQHATCNMTTDGDKAARNMSSKLMLLQDTAISTANAALSGAGTGIATIVEAAWHRAIKSVEEIISSCLDSEKFQKPIQDEHVRLRQRMENWKKKFEIFIHERLEDLVWFEKKSDEFKAQVEKGKREAKDLYREAKTAGVTEFISQTTTLVEMVDGQVSSTTDKINDAAQSFRRRAEAAEEEMILATKKFEGELMLRARAFESSMSRGIDMVEDLIARVDSTRALLKELNDGITEAQKSITLAAHLCNGFSKTLTTNKGILELTIEKDLYQAAVKIFDLLDKDVFSQLSSVPPVAQAEIHTAREMLAFPLDVLTRTRKALEIVKGMAGLSIERIKAASALAAKGIHTFRREAENLQTTVDAKMKHSRKGKKNQVVPAELTSFAVINVDRLVEEMETGVEMQMVRVQLNGSFQEVVHAIEFVFSHIDAAVDQIELVDSSIKSSVNQSNNDDDSFVGASVSPSSSSSSSALSTIVVIQSSTQFQDVKKKIKGTIEKANLELKQWVLDVKDRLQCLNEEGKTSLKGLTNELETTFENATADAVASAMGLANGLGDFAGNILGENINGGEVLKQLGGSAAIKLKEMGKRWLARDESWKVRERTLSGVLCIAQRIEDTAQDMEKLRVLKVELKKINEDHVNSTSKDMKSFGKKRAKMQKKSIQAVQARLGISWDTKEELEIKENQSKKTATNDLETTADTDQSIEQQKMESSPAFRLLEPLRSKVTERLALETHPEVKMVLRRPDLATQVQTAMESSWEDSEDTVKGKVDELRFHLEELQVKLKQERDPDKQEILLLEYEECESQLEETCSNLTGISQQMGVVIEFLGDLRRAMVMMDQKLDALKKTMDAVADDLSFLVSY